MTTFTLQDLTPNTNEPTERLPVEDMNKLNDFIQNHHVDNGLGKTEVIQGATGAQYTFVDTSPNPQPNIHQLADQLTLTFNTLIKQLLDLQTQAQPVSSCLHECVDTVLGEADWLMEKLEDAMDNRYDMKDLIAQGVDDSVRESVDSFFSNEFTLEDHVDVYSMVDTAVEDKLDDVVEDKLADVVEEKLNELLQSKNITISFT